MKTCSYCGGENLDDATNCQKCGTDEFGTIASSQLTFQQRGWFVYVMGWMVFILSIGFTLSTKSADPSSANVLLSWIFLGILVVVSLTYNIMRLVSTKWRQKAVRHYFSPYIIGATCWLLLFVVCAIVDYFFG
jgi:hypothetical protein